MNILAGNTPAALLGSPGELFQAISGTSMSSPHVAGIYALVKQAHPDWSPAAAKSALMTTARQDVVEEDGVTPADPFDMGAGHVRPGGNVRTKGTLFNPGLVYDAGLNDYLGYVCDVAPDAISQATCDRLEADGYATSAENLNLASIGVADVTGFATITRTITNVATKTMTWSADVDAPDGFTAVVTPDQIRLAPRRERIVRGDVHPDDRRVRRLELRVPDLDGTGLRGEDSDRSAGQGDRLPRRGERARTRPARSTCR